MQIQHIQIVMHKFKFMLHLIFRIHRCLFSGQALFPLGSQGEAGANRIRPMPTCIFRVMGSPMNSQAIKEVRMGLM